ncbi:phosphatidylglycerophosphatase A [Salmonella enterica subsp. enterica]|nr:phosphatidylglycerophosphatase A [Salmonella enterica subsp. enterica]
MAFIFAIRRRKIWAYTDHGSIVWDEFIGMWITLMALPTTDWQWVAAGFVIFRILDMWKPWPIRWFDRNVHGGMGIMIDDIVAGRDIRRHTVFYRSSLAARYYLKGLPDGGVNALSGLSPNNMSISQAR